MPFKSSHISTFVTFWLFMPCVFLVLPHSALGQPTDKQRAVLAFDVNLRQVANILPDEKQMAAPFGSDGVVRVYGAMAAPRSISAFRRIDDSSSPLGFEGFLRLQFASEDAANKASARKEDDGLEAITIGGNEYLRPRSTNTAVPPNVLLRRVSPTAIEIGTRAYLTRSNPNVFTKSLSDAWSKMGGSAFRLAIDFENSQHLIDEAIRDTQGGIPLPAQPLVMIARSTRVLQLRFDLVGQELMQLTANAKDHDSAKNVHTMLSGMLEIIRHGALQSLNTSEKETRLAGTQVLSSLACRIDGKQVTISAPRPQGFENVVALVLASIKSRGVQPKHEFLPGIGPRPDATPAEKEAFSRGLLEGFLDAAKERRSR